ncbi:MAG: hypothetical protein Kow00107_01010 [Planctomycetota bacterium]
MTTETVPTFPHLILREAVVGFVVLGSLALLALFVPLELLPPATPEYSETARKAPWFFVGIQEMLYHFPPKWTAAVLPSAAVVYLLLFPYLSWKRVTLERLAALKLKWPAVLVWFALAVAIHLVSVEPFYPQVVLTALFGLLVLYAVLRPEAAFARITLQELFLAYLLSSYVLWTLIGQFLRSDDWEPVWPFLG